MTNKNTSIRPGENLVKECTKHIIYKERHLYKISLRVILSFLNDDEKLKMLLINSVFADIVKKFEIFYQLFNIRNILTTDHNTFPIEILLCQDVVLLSTILNEYDLKSLTQNLLYIKFISKWINTQYFQVGYYNEKFDNEIYIQNLNLSGLNLTDFSLVFILHAINYNTIIRKINLRKNNISLELIENKNLYSNFELYCLEEFDLSFNNISNWSYVQKLLNNSRVENLNLSGNPLKNFSKEYQENNNQNNNILKRTNLSNNSEFDYETLKIILKFNSSITEINLSNNSMKEEEAKYFQALSGEYFFNLTSIDLSNNKLGADGVSFIASILSINNLITSLNLNKNLISHKGLKHVNSNLIKNKNSLLKYLYIADNFICTFENEEGNKLIYDLIINTKLEELDISNNCLLKRGCYYVGEAIKNNIYLKKLNLRNNKISDKGARFIADALRNNHTLEEIDLSNNLVDEFDDLGCLDIDSVRLIKENTGKISKETANTVLPSILKCSKNIKKFNMSENKFIYVDCFSLVDGLNSSFCKLTHLNLEKNEIGDAGINNLEKYFKHTNFLKLIYLNLSLNNIGIDGIKILTNHMIKFKSEMSLKELNLSNNNIDAEGICYLSEFFLINSSSNLCSLDLSNNELQIQGMKTLTDSLYDDKNLEILSICNNKITEIYCIGNFLSYNSTLLHLNLKGNPISKKYINILIDYLPINVTLNRISVEFKDINI